MSKKILILGFLPPPLEGTSIITKLLAEHREIFAEADIKISFLFLSKRKHSANRGKWAFINLALNVWNIIRFIAKIIAFRPETVYQPLAQNKTGFIRDSIFIVISRLLKKKIILHFHGGSFDKFYELTAGNLLKKYIRKILSYPSRIICLADSIREEFHKFTPPDNTTYLYNYAPAIPYQATSSGKTSNEKIFLYMGYLSRAKGCVDIVKAAVRVVKERQDARFILCGQPIDIERNITFISQPHGGYSEIISILDREKDIVSRELIKILPPVEGAEKEKLLREAYAFIYPSYSEGCPMAVMEALSYGLPLILTPVGALPEMFNDSENCFFVKPGNYHELSDKILYLIDHPIQAAAIGANNAKISSEKFNEKNFLKKFTQIISL